MNSLPDKRGQPLRFPSLLGQAIVLVTVLKMSRHNSSFPGENRRGPVPGEADDHHSNHQLYEHTEMPLNLVILFTSPDQLLRQPCPTTFRFLSVTARDPAIAPRDICFPRRDSIRQARRMKI